jgi:enamine deaminase RidA (YjgF/YER057c/UK114 family)
MSHLQYFSYAGFGEKQRKALHYSQAVRIDNRIEVSGQGSFAHLSPTLYHPHPFSIIQPLTILGGWDRATGLYPPSIGAEVDQAFENVDVALKDAGGKGWEQVYKVRVFWIARNGLKMEEVAGEAVRNLVKWCPDHGPLATFIEVKGLYEEMSIEIEVEAHLGS